MVTRGSVNTCIGSISTLILSHIMVGQAGAVAITLNFSMLEFFSKIQNMHLSVEKLRLPTFSLNFCNRWHCSNIVPEIYNFVTISQKKWWSLCFPGSRGPSFSSAKQRNNFTFWHCKSKSKSEVTHCAVCLLQMVCQCRRPDHIGSVEVIWRSETSSVMMPDCIIVHWLASQTSSPKPCSPSQVNDWSTLTVS